MTAAARARESERADRLFEDPCAAALAGEEGCRFLEQDEALRPDRPKAAFVLRHRFFDDFLLGRAVDGVRQVVLVAAGLDARAFRLAWPTGVRVFELDQPGVLSYKEAIVREAGACAAAPSQGSSSGRVALGVVLGHGLTHHP
jgi:methyltransferase (TIGR00027 family)